MIDPITGKPVRNIMKEFRMDEISAVDRPAQAEAKMTIMKRDSKKTLNQPSTGDVHVAGQDDDELKKVLETAVTDQRDGHAHIIVGLRASQDGLAEVRSGLTSFADGHAHAWAMDEAGNILIADEEGHTHGIAAMMQKQLTPEEPAAPEEDNPPAGDSSAESIGDSGEATMTEQKTPAADPAVTPEQLEKLQKRLEKAERYGQLNDAEKAFMKSLDEADQAEFLDLDDSERRDRLAKAQEEDKVVYTSEDGDVFRKSDDPRLVKQAKQLDEERKRRKQMEEKAEKTALEKRASELPFAGDLESRTLLLKAISVLPEQEREKAEQVLKANAERLESAMKTLGTSAAGNPEADPIEDIAKRIREKDPTLTESQAYAKALETPEGQAAFAKMRSN